MRQPRVSPAATWVVGWREARRVACDVVGFNEESRADHAAGLGRRSISDDQLSVDAAECFGFKGDADVGHHLIGFVEGMEVRAAFSHDRLDLLLREGIHFLRIEVAQAKVFHGDLPEGGEIRAWRRFSWVRRRACLR